jgi:hypothetical protein
MAGSMTKAEGGAGQFVFSANRSSGAATFPRAPAPDDRGGPCFASSVASCCNTSPSPSRSAPSSRSWQAAGAPTASRAPATAPSVTTSTDPSLERHRSSIQDSADGDRVRAPADRAPDRAPPPVDEEVSSRDRTRATVHGAIERAVVVGKLEVPAREGAFAGGLVAHGGIGRAEGPRSWRRGALDALSTAATAVTTCVTRATYSEETCAGTSSGECWRAAFSRTSMKRTAGMPAARKACWSPPRPGRSSRSRGSMVIAGT